MNDEYLDQLISSHLHGTLTPEQHQSLEQRLLHSAADRQRFWQEAETHAMLHHLMQSDSEIFSANTEPIRKKTLRDFSLRPFLSIAAGIMFGMFCTSLVFGYVVPWASDYVSPNYTLVNGNFEKLDGRIASGFPASFGQWSGDHTEIVSKTSHRGRKSLRFVKAEDEQMMQGANPTACDVYQIVDLRPFRDQLASGEALLKLSAQFLDAREVSDEPLRFSARLHAFSGDITTKLSKEDALASCSDAIISKGGALQGWKTTTSRIFLPSDADFALIHLSVSRWNNDTSSNSNAVIGEQFVDDIKLQLKFRPTLTERIAQH
jgi:hypothetical protein